MATAKPHHTSFIIGLTGGIGSGKSAASDWFHQQGIVVVDADVIAHEVVTLGSPTLEKIRLRFGDWVIAANGELNRPALREHVFHDTQALIQLESIMHPAIREATKKQLNIAQSPYIILSAPLLLEASEAGLVNLCDRVLVIDAPESLQLKRACQRDHQEISNIKAIMSNQLSRAERLRHADDVVINDTSLDALYQQLLPLHHHYLQLAEQKSIQLSSS